ncbi:helix-turn-helix transcriptional regulator [Acidovorax sp.]|uniref:S24 family peptidase n=1 Tax=Acidovorax sp. TaxID=1872122 RepID=UPI0039194E07
MNTTDPFVLALQRLCDRVGGHDALAARIGANGQSIYQIVSQRKLPSGNPKGVGPNLRAKITQAFPDWLDQALESDASVIPSAHSLQNEISDVVIRQFETGGSMGRGIVLAEQPGVIKEWRVSDRWAQENVHRITATKNLAIVTGFGPSMQPLFNPGDPLLVDTGINRADVDGIYFFRVGEEGFVKQLQRIPTAGGLVLRAKSYNTLYDPFDIVAGMDFEVFARVVKVWKGEEF